MDSLSLAWNAYCMRRNSDIHERFTVGSRVLVTTNRGEFKATVSQIEIYPYNSHGYRIVAYTDCQLWAFVSPDNCKVLES